MQKDLVGKRKWSMYLKVTALKEKKNLGGI